MIMHSVASLSESVCLVRALTFESLDLETHFQCAGRPTSREYLVEVYISRSSGQGQGHMCKNGIYKHN